MTYTSSLNDITLQTYGEKMFVSFTDWEFDGNVDNVVQGIKANWAEMQKYGAVNTRCTVTGENTLEL